jgi:hypothetical protein
VSGYFAIIIPIVVVVVVIHLRRNKWSNTMRKSAQSGHWNSVSFQFLRLRNALHVDLVISCASASLSSGSSSSSMKSLMLDSAASSSY